MRLSLIVSPVVATLVGFGGTVALIISAAQAVGADAAHTVSWLTGLSLATAGTTLVLSLWHRIPIIAAWSTPGAALIAASGGTIGLQAAVGAFLLAAVLVLLTAAIRPIGELIGRIPTPVAAGMLAGVLLRFVLEAFAAAQASPGLVLPLIALFLVVRLFSPAWAVLAVLAAGVVLAFGLGLTAPMPSGVTLSGLQIVLPRFEPAVLVGLGLPLYLVTMASQNLPGFAVLKAAGYPVPARSILAVSGVASLLTAPFGAHMTNLAAITAAICTGPDTHPDPGRRWIAGPVYALCWLLVAALGASLVAVFAALPGALVKTVAGLALLGPLLGAMTGAMGEERHRFPAVLTLVVTASGFTLAGVGSAFWGLIFGLAVVGLDALRRQG